MDMRHVLVNTNRQITGLTGWIKAMKAIVLTCPLCSRKLRIAEDLLGQEVLCPTCAGTFTAPATDVSPPSSPANEEEPARALAIVPRQIIPPVPAAKVRLVGEEEGKPYHSDSPAHPARIQISDCGFAPLASGQRGTACDIFRTAVNICRMKRMMLRGPIEIVSRTGPG
jgi:hypothetical protein